MARSTYIYVVLKSNNSIVEPVAAFTVKREMKNWLGKQQHVEWLSVFRVRDNPIWNLNDHLRWPIPVDITLDVINDV